MLVIDFLILPLDRAVSPLWQPGKRVDLGGVAEMDLRYEYFWSQIEFSIDGVDIGDRWGGVPLLDFAASIKAVPEQLSKREEVTIDFTESSIVVSFDRNGETVRVSDNTSLDSITCTVKELAEAINCFIRKISTTLTNIHPDIKKNEFFRRLFFASR